MERLKFTTRGAQLDAFGAEVSRLLAEQGFNITFLPARAAKNPIFRWGYGFLQLVIDGKEQPLWVLCEFERGCWWIACDLCDSKEIGKYVFGSFPKYSQCRPYKADWDRYAKSKVADIIEHCNAKAEGRPYNKQHWDNKKAA